jgi:hypothetical protein
MLVWHVKCFPKPFSSDFSALVPALAAWSTMRHQAFFYNHAMFGGTVGSRTSRCYDIESSSKACMKGGRAGGDTCLMRHAMCLETRCNSKGVVQAVFKFPDGKEEAVDCPSGLLFPGMLHRCTFIAGRGCGA